jgi:uroporphyrinogen-III synthase
VRLLLTRPEPDAERTARLLRARGHTVVVAPLLQIEAVAEAEIGTGAAILVTSANAAQAVAARQQRTALCHLPVFAVGERSAQAMRAAGFANVTSADGSVGDLARLVAARMPSGASLVYLSGADRAGDLAGDLRATGFAVETIVVYRAVAIATLPQRAAEALAGGLHGVLHFSRRSAAAYVNAARAAGQLASALKPAQFCLSAPIAEPLQRAGAVDVHIARRPTEAALVELIGFDRR